MRSIVEFGHQPSPGQTPIHDMDQGLQRLRQEDLFAVPASAIGDDIEELRRHINCCEASLAGSSGLGGEVDRRSDPSINL